MDTRQIQIVIDAMERLENEHPSAKVKFNAGNHEIGVIYPLPEDFYYVGVASETIGQKNY